MPEGIRVAFPNDCFDLGPSPFVPLGKPGPRLPLVVAINADASLRPSQGSQPPFVPQVARARSVRPRSRRSRGGYEDTRRSA